MADRLSFDVAGTQIPLYAQETIPTAGSATRPAILLLHGSGGHVDFWVSRMGGLLTEARIGLYAPQYFARTGTQRADLTTITDGVHVPLWLEAIDAALRFVAARPTVDPEQIVLAGVSLGGFLSLALAARLSASTVPADWQRIRALIDVSGGLVAPFDDMATAHMPPTLILHGAADPIVEVRFAHQLSSKLRSLGVACTEEILLGEGHWFSPAALPRILMAVSAFLQKQLKM